MVYLCAIVNLKINFSMKKSIKKSVFVLAWDLKKSLSLNMSDALSWAWYLVKENLEDCLLISFTKKSGENVKRIVSKSISKFYTFKGSDRKAKEGLNKFIDLSKVAKNLITGKKSSLFTSCYNYNTL